MIIPKEMSTLINELSSKNMLIVQKDAEIALLKSLLEQCYCQATSNFTDELNTMTEKMLGGRVKFE